MITRPVLFLDIDGVLNSHAWWAVQSEKWLDKPGPKGDTFDLHIDHVAVERLNRVLSASGAMCILSSTWRKKWTLDGMRTGLRRRGFTGVLAGATPVLEGARRGAEIQAWLDGHHEPRACAIVDDDADMLHLMPRLVQTSVRVGLTENDADRLIALLCEDTTT